MKFLIGACKAVSMPGGDYFTASYRPFNIVKAESKLAICQRNRAVKAIHLFTLLMSHPGTGHAAGAVSSHAVAQKHYITVHSADSYFFTRHCL